MNTRFSFFLLLCVAFLDYMGVGLVFPILPAMLFGGDSPLLPNVASDLSRGVWMGVLIALTPLFQFLASPILGSLSDQRGRKKMILFGLSLGFLGYLCGIVGVGLSSLSLLVLYRCLVGVSTATMTVIQATVADMSTKENKGRNFAYYNMALGMGFTLGPFLGGTLCDSSMVSWFNYTTPFAFGAVATGINLVLLKYIFEETHVVKAPKKIELLRGFRQAGRAFAHPSLRYAFVAFFFFVLGWDYFAQFFSVTLIKLHSYSTGKIGGFYGLMGLSYALSNALLVGRLTKKWEPEKMLRISLSLGGIYLLGFHLIQNPLFYWFCIPGLVVIMSLFYPLVSTYLSDAASDDEQGEMMGIWNAVMALALIASPLLSGSLVGKYPTMPITLGAALMGCGGVIFALRKRKLAESFDK